MQAGHADLLHGFYGHGREVLNSGKRLGDKLIAQIAWEQR